MRAELTEVAFDGPLINLGQHCPRVSKEIEPITVCRQSRTMVPSPSTSLFTDISSYLLVSKRPGAVNHISANDLCSMGGGHDRSGKLPGRQAKEVRGQAESKPLRAHLSSQTSYKGKG